MSDRNKVVALNGSPHEGFGNTSQMIAMLGENLRKEGFDLEEIFLSRQHIEYCTGCGVCLEKGGCWIRDDYKAVAKKVLEADAVILASPVYFLHVTAQMKTFLDRSLGYGHRPRGSWKPGLAVSVSAGMGETGVAQYLGGVLKVFGAFPVGHFTALATGPGGFLGREAVEARAADWARDLVRAVKEDRRYPATDQELFYWLFMGNLIKEHREFMKADDEHWQKLGLYESFEAYVGQTRAQIERTEESREAWIKTLMENRSQSSPGTQPTSTQRSHPKPFNVKELLKAMPNVLDSEAAKGVAAVYQFEVTGQENFTAHLSIANQQATFQEGPAANPDVIIKTPAEVWLAISTGELSGMTAYMTGKFKAKGNLGLLMKLNSLFKTAG
jgi:multimeric flavodoxin WrbA/putative sterol carrier protein